MKTSIDHLPELRQQQINEIVEVIKDFVAPQKIILYGSRASGTFTEDKYEKNGIIYYYISDYDVAIITNKTNLKEYEVENEVLKKVKVRPDLNVVMYDIDYFNKALKEGKYFFVTLYEDGILIYDNHQVDLVHPAALSMEQVRRNSLDNYNHWITQVDQYYEFALIGLQKAIDKNEKPNVAISMLYQAIEGIYSVILLVFTGKKPKIHNLYKYRNSVKGFSTELDSIFPFPTKDKYEYNLFDLLKRAYIGAKYKIDFEVSFSEVKDMSIRVEKMIRITKLICIKRIDEYGKS
ncbi:HEPN domain-containing protein [Mucilaginibacter sp. SP1R1]|uniref:HEPN domain-containing protein n=1 Tax=Mucilaginibacter sp. SP1R1 TaxID=2723091 RepID=UPI001620F1A7|nr:HEPN domain-containing protein [Mucilaginibacter sp. SP1R1]MBB6152390.1 putative nucleotidyltransferase [Mucilaginibacter sp. SP1R1]